MIHKVGFFLFYRQYEIGDILLGIMGLLWGLWVLNPFMTTFELASYLAFNQVLPEWLWGLAVATLGLVTIIAAVCKTEYVFRATTLLMNVFIWFFIATQFFLSEPSNTGVVVYFVTSLGAIWLYLRFTIFEKMINFSPDDLVLIRESNRR